VTDLLLPQSHECLVCGRDNPRGLGLRLRVEPVSGIVRTHIRPARNQVGFDEVIHGGLIATVADEAMVWAATWTLRRFCFCGELQVRFRRPASPGMSLTFEARVESFRSRLVLTTFRCIDADGVELSSGSGKYVPLSEEQHQRVLESFVDEAESRSAVEMLRKSERE
jgi:acyl-coenzyme A thioesterase PaaI-like protein